MISAQKNSIPNYTRSSLLMQFLILKKSRINKILHSVNIFFSKLLLVEYHTSKIGMKQELSAQFFSTVHSKEVLCKRARFNTSWGDN